MRRARVLVTAAVACTLGLAASAEAAAPNLLLRLPEERLSPGSGAAELNNPRGVAGDPDTGHLYVSDLGNVRVSEYTAWGLFVKSWGWGVADGATAPQTCGPPQPEAAPDPSLCREGIEGSAPGQLNAPIGVAVDPFGAVYVHELGNRRVQKFNPAGQFLLTFGGDVNKTKVAASAPQAQRDVCPVDPGDVCGAGTAGTGPAHLANSVHDFIAYNPVLDAIVVGGQDRIQIFNLNGTFREQIDFEGPLAAFDGKTVEALDVDADGHVYLVVGGLPDLYKLSAAGVPLAPGKPGESSFEMAHPIAVAVDAEGVVYGVEQPSGAFPPGFGSYVLGFAADGTPIEGMEAGDKFAGPETDAFPEFSGPVSADLTGIGTNMCAGSAGPNLYAARFDAWEGSRSYVSAYGPPPVGCEPPPPRAPDILDQLAATVGTSGATLKARINPRFWADTTYYVEFGTGKCSEDGCDRTQPVPPGALLTNQTVSDALLTAGVLLQGLEPNTTYHYRFVAESSGGGPVYGIDPDGTGGPKGPTPTEGLEGTFTTFSLPRHPHPCPNDAVRGGASADLPDCRAYELVSPLDKGNTDVGLLRERRFVEMNQAATSGDRFTFSSVAAFGELEGAPYFSQYLAQRGPEGWAARSISAARTTPPIDLISGMNNEFKGFSADLCQGWLRHNSTTRLTEDAVLGYPNLYRRDNCAEPPAYEAITTDKPNRPAKNYLELAVKGFSEDGKHTIFVAEAKLHKDAPVREPREQLLYEHLPGETRFVCYLPNGKPSPEACSAGTAGRSGPDISSLHNAISTDGSHIFWTAYTGRSDLREAHPGVLYVRIDGKQTVAVSGSVTTAASFFWTAAADGSKAIFEVVEGPLTGNLYEFDVASQTPRLIAEEVEGPMGASEDGSRIYLASRKALAPGGTGGAHNLYLYEAGEGGGPGSFRFVARLVDEDFGALGFVPAAGIPKAVHRQPVGRWASVSADGRFAAFTSSMTPPSGFDNRDVSSGEPAAEVYRYDAATGQLLCISCNRTGARPAAADIAGFTVAARLPGWEIYFHSPHVLSSDGQRVFFESHEALVPADTNGAWDVYQWEAPGKGTCSADDPTYGAEAGGCVELISSGRSPADSEFLDADPDGQSAFIATQASLVGSDYGLNDVYVARVGGGFPEPGEEGECEGEACQSPPPTPPAATPGSRTYQGPPDPSVKPKRRPCPKGKRRVKRAGKFRCVPKKRKGKAARRRGSTRRAGR